MPTPRLITNTREPVRCDWPDGAYVQGGSRGVVMGPAGSYRTAFVEAFPDNTFIRGEGDTIEGAEQACWQRYQQLRACPQYPAHGPWDRRSYRNGSAFCASCGAWFSRSTTGLDELPEDPDQPPGLLERAFRKDRAALVEILSTMADVDQLPARPDDAPDSTATATTSTRRGVNDMKAHSIRVLNFMGDQDDYDALHLIGPYESADARDRDLARLVALPDDGNVQFEASDLDPAGVDVEYRATPDEVADVTRAEGVIDVLWHMTPAEEG